MAPSPSRSRGSAPMRSTGSPSKAERLRPRRRPAADTTRQLAFLGRPVPGSRSASSIPRPGTCCATVRSASSRSGHLGHARLLRAARRNAEVFVDGWFRTGDLAYTVDGEMVMCGRIKDMIIVGGRNVYPRRDRAGRRRRSTGVRAGNVIVFGVDGRQGKQSLTVVAETGEPTSTALRRAISTGSTHRRRPRQGHRPRRRRAACPRPRRASSSGRCRDQYLAREL